MVPQKHTESGVCSETLTIPELEQSKSAVLNTLASVHSRRSYAYAIDRFIAWYCRDQVDVQSRGCCAIPIPPRKPQPISRYDQPPSFSDPPTGR